jgi:hypothetical protein
MAQIFLAVKYLNYNYFLKRRAGEAPGSAISAAQFAAMELQIRLLLALALGRRTDHRFEMALPFQSLLDK